MSGSLRRSVRFSLAPRSGRLWDWPFCDFGGKGRSDRHSCLSDSFLKQVKTGKNACLLEFGHFHCRLAASEGRPAFQGRSRQTNPKPRRGATDEMANLNGVRDSSAADVARLPNGGAKVPALKGRPTVKRRDAAAKPAFRGPANLISRQKACFMVGTS